MRLQNCNAVSLKLSLFVSIFLFGLSNNLILNAGNNLNIQASTSYKGSTDTTHTYDEAAKGVNISGQGIVLKADKTLGGDGVNLNSNDGKLALSGKESVNFVEAQETHLVEQSHSDDALTVKGYIGNKWVETAKV